MGSSGRAVNQNTSLVNHLACCLLRHRATHIQTALLGHSHHACALVCDQTGLKGSESSVEVAIEPAGEHLDLGADLGHPVELIATPGWLGWIHAFQDVEDGHLQRGKVLAYTSRRVRLDAGYGQITLDQKNLEVFSGHRSDTNA